MRRASRALLLTVISGASLLLAQTPSEANNLRAAREKLNYFVGTWTLEIHTKGGPLGGMVFLGNEHNELLPGGSLLVSRQEGVDSPVSGGLSILAYNVNDKTYTYHVVKSTGEVEDLRGTLKGNTWTWTNDELAAGKAPKIRLTIQEFSAKSYGLKLETTSGEQDWSVVMEGEAHKSLTYARPDVAFRR